MVDIVFPCFSVNFLVFGDQKLAMKVENLKSGCLCDAPKSEGPIDQP